MRHDVLDDVVSESCVTTEELLGRLTWRVMWRFRCASWLCRRGWFGRWLSMRLFGYKIYTWSGPWHPGSLLGPP